MDRALALSALDAEINMLMDMRVGDRLVTTPRRFRLYVQQVLTFLTVHGPTCKVAFLEHLTHPLTKKQQGISSEAKIREAKNKAARTSLEDSAPNCSDRIRYGIIKSQIPAKAIGNFRSC